MNFADQISITVRTYSGLFIFLTLTLIAEILKLERIQQIVPVLALLAGLSVVAEQIFLKMTTTY